MPLTSWRRVLTSAPNGRELEATEIAELFHAYGITMAHGGNAHQRRPGLSLALSVTNDAVRAIALGRPGRRRRPARRRARPPQRPVDPIGGAAELARSVPGVALITGSVDEPSADPRALKDAILRIACLADDLPELAELALHPLIAPPSGVVVQAAHGRVSARARSGAVAEAPAMTRLAVIGPEEAAGHAVEDHPEGPHRVRAAMAGVADLHLGADLHLVEGREADGRRAGPCALAQLSAPARGRLSIGRGTARPGHVRAGRDRGQPPAGPPAPAWSPSPPSAPARPTWRSCPPALRDTTRWPGARWASASSTTSRWPPRCAPRRRGERVLIVDWDVHHGNGTQDLFWDDDQRAVRLDPPGAVLPGHGPRSTRPGAPDARGLTVNVPLPAGRDRRCRRAALERVVAPVVERFAPTWVLVSAGFDAHRADPLADLRLSAGDFGGLSSLVAGFAPRPGRLALFLEGGYDPEALRSSVAASLATLVGGDAGAEPPTQGGPGLEAVELAAAVHARIAKEEPWA